MARILIMGLPGSGKTTLAKALCQLLDNTRWYNADEVRKQFDDWDFSEEGRKRQAHRMREFAESDVLDNTKHTICDFVAPTEELRNIYNADITIWMDTIKSGRYADTNAVFVEPLQWVYRITEYDSEKHARYIADELNQL